MDDDTHGKPKSGNFKKRSGGKFDNGKRKRNNSYPGQDHSSGTLKAIETVYRILCPVKKIGSVLGKGGEIVNALRDQTRAKIRVADAIPGAEERVIIIFNYPSKQSEKNDDDQNHVNDDSKKDNVDNMRPNCPAQDALLKVHDRIAADEQIRGGVVLDKAESNDDVTARILVPTNQVGCLLGKGGTVIKKLRSDYTGASIRVLPNEHLPPCAMKFDELVQISGTPSIVKKALYDISTRLHDHPRKENPPIEDLIIASTVGLQPGASISFRPLANPMWSHHERDSYATPPPLWSGGYRNESSGYAGSSYNISTSHIGRVKEAPEEFSLRLLCPTGRIGGVIGKAGANVRQVEHETHARIQVEDISSEAEERIINVSSTEGPWDQISPTIEALLQLQRRTSGTTEEGMMTTRLLVPSSKVGCLLGQGGNIINEMRRHTRADIRVCSKQDKPNYISANEELVQISGTPDVAREALLEVASRLRKRTFRIDDVTVNPVPMFRDQGFGPAERMSDRGLPSSRIFGAATNPPIYPEHGYDPPAKISNRGPPASNLIRADNPVGYDYPEYPKGPPPAYGTHSNYPPGPPSYEHSYPRGPPPPAAVYSNMSSSTMEIRIPSSAVSSVYGNISDIRQISGARVKLLDTVAGSLETVVEIQGSSEQLKAAQSLLQAFVASGGGPNLPQPPMQAPLYRQY